MSQTRILPNPRRLLFREAGWLQTLILGLDPGSRNAGFGIVEVTPRGMKHVVHGVIKLKESWAFHHRLRVLHEELGKLFAAYVIADVAIENIFFGKNADSAFKLGHARGVCLLAASSAGAEIHEYAARYVKKCITGTGAAEKELVQRMVFAQLGVQPKESAFDASDALSLAVTHALMRDVNKRMQKQLEEEANK